MLCAFNCLVILIVFLFVVKFTPFDARCIWHTHATKTWNKSYNLIEAVLTETQTFHNFKSFVPVSRSINQLQIFIRTETTFPERSLKNSHKGRQNRTMMKIFGILFCVVFTVQAHDEYRGKCPTFRPMQGFDWNRVR